MFTFLERTVRRYTVADAVKAAEVRLKGVSMCINAISGRDMKDAITLEELNTISDHLVDDSVAHHW